MAFGISPHDTDNKPSIFPGGLRRTPDVLPQEQVHRGRHHQQWQGVIILSYDGYKMSIMIMAWYNTMICAGVGATQASTQTWPGNSTVDSMLSTPSL